MGKKLLIVTALALMIGAGTLAAQANLTGTFSGDMEGSWHTTITLVTSEESDIPVPVFDGVWTANAEPYDGYLTGKGYTTDCCYVFEEADIANHDGELIGHWSGSFNYVNDQYMTGPWHTFDGAKGKWGGGWQ